MDRTRIELDPLEVEGFPHPMNVSSILPELASLGVDCDEESFRAQAQALGEPYKIADLWRRQVSRIPTPDPFNVYAIVLWMEFCAGRPCGDLAVVELAALSWNEMRLGEEEFLREAISRTIALGRLAYELRADAPGEWLRELVDACPGWDVLDWVARFLIRLHSLRRRSSVLAICRVWMPLLRDLWAGDPLLGFLPCLCLSGSPLVVCCGRWGRG